MKGKVVSKMPMHDYDEWGGGWPCDDLSEQVFYKSQVFH